jgi:cytochrome d ubiquinol oxidase subunit II
MHINAKIWTDFFDFLFSAASILLAIFFGAALGNVIRGVPLGPDHYFFAPLWTDFTPGANPGVLDWYTVLSAIVALVALMLHGSLWVAMKTEGPLNARMRSLVRLLLPGTAVLTIANLAATVAVRPGLLDNYRANPAGWIIPAAVVATLAGIAWFHRAGRERIAFLCCCAYIVAMLAGAAYALYPVLLPASTGPANSITIYNAATGPNSLSVGLVWWSAGMLVAIGYFVFIYWLFAGKVRVSTGDHGY